MDENKKYDLILAVTDGIYYMAQALAERTKVDTYDWEKRDCWADIIHDREEELQDALDKFFEACYNGPKV